LLAAFRWTGEYNVIENVLNISVDIGRFKFLATVRAFFLHLEPVGDAMLTEKLVALLARGGFVQ